LIKPERYYFGSAVLGLICVALFIPNTIAGTVKPWQLLLLSLLQVLLFVYSYRRDRAYQRAEKRAMIDDDRR
jgi:Ca2+/Na+ antiporter